MLNKATPTEGVLRLKGIEALKDVADGRATKIFMPSDISAVVETLGVAAEALGIGNSTAVDDSERPKAAPEIDPCIHQDTGAGGIEAAVATEAIIEDVENQSEDL